MFTPSRTNISETAYNMDPFERNALPYSFSKIVSWCEVSKTTVCIRGAVRIQKLVRMKNPNWDRRTYFGIG